MITQYYKKLEKFSCTFRVIKTKNGKYPIGSLLLNNKGWRSHFISDGSDLNWIQFDLNGSNYSYCLSILGMPG